jgi:hypothetical protein
MMSWLGGLPEVKPACFFRAKPGLRPGHNTLYFPFPAALRQEDIRKPECRRWRSKRPNWPLQCGTYALHTGSLLRKKFNKPGHLRRMHKKAGASFMAAPVLSSTLCRLCLAQTLF